MISNNIYEIDYEGFNVQVVSDVNQYVFSYLYANYIYVDSVLLADDYAQSISGNTSSSAYKNALWNKSKDFTIHLFSNASHALAELIYNAWLQAGSPSMTAATEDLAMNELRPVLYQNIPNPFKESTTISYFLPDNMQVQLYIRNSEGMMVDTLVDGYRSAGEYSIEWNRRDHPGGIYYLVCHAGSFVEVKKLILIDR
jgi:hypothetical protein